MPVAGPRCDCHRFGVGLSLVGFFDLQARRVVDVFIGVVGELPRHLIEGLRLCHRVDDRFSRRRIHERLSRREIHERLSRRSRRGDRLGVGLRFRPNELPQISVAGCIRAEQGFLQAAADRESPGVLIHHVDVEVHRLGLCLLDHAGAIRHGHDHRRLGSRSGPGSPDGLVVLLDLVEFIGEIVVALPVRIVAVPGRRAASPDQAGPGLTVEHPGGQGDIARPADRLALVDEHRHQNKEPKHHE